MSISSSSEAKKRDHRKIGKEMELFMFSERVGKGLPIWLPKGTQLRLRLQDVLRHVLKPYHYQEVITPGIGSKNLYVTSGHYAHYGKDSFQPIHTPEPDEEYMLKPMNCPHHCEVYARKPRSYKDLPLRIAEFGTVFRYEKSGELHGLTRVRTFTQDDAHIFVRPDQVKSEFESIIDIILKVFKIFGFEDYDAQISLRDPKDTDKYIGSDEIWEESENAIRQACKEKGLHTHEELGEAAFYGPKLDFMVKDAIGRKWQLGTIQVDYNLPERFKLEYTAEDNSKKTPVMIHRAPFGSLERFTAVLIEHTAGHFPCGSLLTRSLSCLSRRSTTTTPRRCRSTSTQRMSALTSMTVTRRSAVRSATTSSSVCLTCLSLVRRKLPTVSCPCVSRAAASKLR